MPDDRREQVRANAKYLRGVRPLDPEELAEYVEGHPHPAVVRQDLREMTHELGVVERSDGTFVPLSDDPVRPAFDGVRALPERWVDAVEDLLVERYGTGWATGESGDALRETVRRLKADYYRGEQVAYDEAVALAYAVYHLPNYYAVAQYVLDELGRDGLLDRRLRVLDVGAGVGGPALGLHDYLAAEETLVDYHAVEPSAAADVFEALVGDTDVRVTVHRETAEAHDPVGEFDLVVFANVLSELDSPTDVVARYLDALAPDGTLVAIAPADLNTSVGLRRVERAVVDERDLASVYAPTVRLWPGKRPTDRGWSFDQRPDIEAPRFQEELARHAEDPDAVRNTTVKFSYALLRPDGARRHDLSLSRSRAAPMAESRDHVTQRVDLVCAKLSRDLSDGGNPLYKVSDGSEDTEHYAVLVRETALNEALGTAGYGDLLSVERGLVLWNDDEGAVNVVVDEETVVDRLA